MDNQPEAHPRSIVTQDTIVQCWDKSDVQVGLVGLDLTERRPDGSTEVVTVDPADYGAVLSTRFGLDLDDEELARFAPLRAPA